MNEQELAQWLFDIHMNKGYDDGIVKWNEIPKTSQKRWLLTARQLSSLMVSRESFVEEVTALINKKIKSMEDKNGNTSEKDIRAAFTLLELRDELKSYFLGSSTRPGDIRTGSTPNSIGGEASVASEDESRPTQSIHGIEGETASVHSILEKKAEDRTKQEHLALCKHFGGVRNYLLSMGKFNDVEIPNDCCGLIKTHHADCSASVATPKRIKCCYCNNDIHIDHWAGIIKEGFICNNTFCLIKLAKKIKEQEELASV
jgi:hypothetical protein